ncbi:MAG: energy-coupling factor ABC transporter ATP-binding protein [Bacteroidales bacterium]|nr:energy-coupling factor ABC transporter ATP-binding protein [Candidatus Latescibacterota bacterium]
MTGNKRLVSLRDIHFSHEGGRSVLSGASLDLFEGQRIGLRGHVGSGKTTVLHIIMGLLKPGSGVVEVFGKLREEEKDFREVRGHAGLLFQDPDDQLFCPTVLEDTAFGPLNQGYTREEALEISTSTLRLLGLDGFGDRITHHLSGGEKRLVSLATVLAMKPEVLLLDEPLSGLDPRSSERIVEILAGLTQAMIVVSHDRSFLESATESSLVVSDGSISAQ